MKHTDAELEKILNKLIAATCSPRGRFSASASYPQLEKLLGKQSERQLTKQPERQLIKQSEIQSEKQLKVQPSKPLKRLLPTRIIAAAATVALLCISTWMAYVYTQSDSLRTVSTLAQTSLITLPDGTSVTLNHFSTLSYPARFDGEKRTVTLSGEAYFEVTKDKTHPFVVQTEAVDVQVLGTHFNVDAYRNSQEVKTTLLEGSVAVSNKSNTLRLILKPNETVIYNKVEHSLIRETTNDADKTVAWRSGKLIFKSMPLEEIARKLSNTFGVEIQIADTSLQNYCVTARFEKDDSLHKILSVLHQAGYFNYSQQANNQIIITAKEN